MQAYYAWSRWRNVLPGVVSRMLKDRVRESGDREIALMSQVAVSDYLNYVRVNLDIIDVPGSERRAREYVERMLEERPLEILSELGDWLDVWLWKWRQRVKLVVGGKEMEEARRFQLRTNRFLSALGFREELLNLTIGSLIRHNEVCFTNLIADSVIRSVLDKFSLHVSDERRLASILNNNPVLILDEVMRKVKSLQHYKGFLVVLRVDRNVLGGHATVVEGWWD